MKRALSITAVLLAFCTVSWAATSNTGKNAYAFLKIGIGAKAEAMAGAYVALADDISSLYNNPAGLAAPVYDIRSSQDFYYEEYEGEGEIDEEETAVSAKPVQFKQNRFFATYINYILDLQAGYIGYARQLNETSVLGGSIQYQDYGTLDRYNSLAEYGGTFGASDIALGVTYSKRATREITVGITGKFIIEGIDSLTSDGMAVDVGGLYRFRDGRTSLGAAVKNLGFQLKGLTKSHRDPLPLLFDVGLSHSLRGLPFTFNADLTVPSDNDVYISIGGQWEAFRPLYLRLGWTSKGKDYKTGSDKDKYGGLAGGFGYHYGDYYIDYAYSSFADIGNVHRLSIGVEF
jgi:hypothetical protein